MCVRDPRLCARRQAGYPRNATADSVSVAGADALLDALTCRISYDRYPGLMEEIRNERLKDFRQTYGNTAPR